MPAPGRALFADGEQLRFLTTRNLSLQYEAIREAVERSRGTLELTSDFIKELHRLAMQDIYSCAGRFRSSKEEPRRTSIRITGSKHRPPEDDYVADQVDAMCESVNLMAADAPIQAAARVMWQLVWIHPFYGGNGRTSRAAGYVALCIKLNQFLPGKSTIMELLDRDREKYIAALQDADSAWSESSVVDVTQLELLLDEMLTRQLANIPRPVIARQEDDPSMFEQGRVIQAKVYPPTTPAPSPPRPIVARQEGTDPSILEPGRATYWAGSPPSPPGDD